MAVATLRRQLDKAFRPAPKRPPGECPGKPTSFVIVRGNRQTRRDGPPCALCGRPHVQTIVVRRVRDFFTGPRYGTVGPAGGEA